jgi:hypothetical protein
LFKHAFAQLTNPCSMWAQLVYVTIRVIPSSEDKKLVSKKEDKTISAVVQSALGCDRDAKREVGARPIHRKLDEQWAYGLHQRRVWQVAVVSVAGRKRLEGPTDR